MTSLKKHNPLPDLDHVMRHVPPRAQERDENGNVIGFLPQAFAHKNGEEYMSVNWLEFFAGNHPYNVSASIAQLKAVLVGNNAKFGVAQVGCVKTMAQSNGKPVRLVYFPSAGNPSHSAVFTAHPTPDTGREDLAREFFKEHY